ncbi:MAG TPA: flippase activity-associated protein Agl23 [Pyrinomonadaceae bacterium]|nr:flippase activity-associated protein Agl23 [Pyrinomonadaceae bacterium]
MSTASTRRARKRQRAHERRAETRGSVRPENLLPAVETGQEIPERAWLVAAGYVLIAAAALRVVALGLKPMHHDEGVNGFFLMNLMRQGVFHYNPENYHGPTLYFLTLPLAFIADKLGALDSVVLRMVTAAFGVGTAWLVLALRRYVGAFAALAGAALVAVSPACVFYSRYYIHEAPFVFFTLGVVVAALRFYETGAASYLLLASASAAMLFATKETAFISAGTLALAWACAYAWGRAAGGGRAGDRRETGLAGFVSGGQAPLAVAGALALFAFLWVLFYSSFFSYSKGVFWDSFKAFDLWSKTGMSAFHEKPAHTYVKWLFEEESPVLLLACVGAAVALFERRKNRFAVFASAWGFGLLAAYSIIKYKTPWLVLSFVVPMCVAAGYGAQALGRVGWNRLLPLLLAFAAGLYALGRNQEALGEVYYSLTDATYHSSKVSAGVALLLAACCAVLLTAFVLAVKWAARGGRTTEWRATAAVAAAALAACLYQTVVLNFLHYDDDRYPYVYSHTRREAVEMVREIERAGERAGTKEPAVAVTSDEYWPLPWYFRDNPRVGYAGKQVYASYDPQATPVVIGRKSDDPEQNTYRKLVPLLAGKYTEVGTYPLRPGVDLVLFVRNDIAPK